MVDMNHLLGRNLGNCALERQVGSGGMGVVYLAQQSRPRRTVAVKVLMPELLPKSALLYSEFLARFRREADAIAALDHVNIIPIYEYGEQEQIAYLVMPYVTGGTLRQVLARRGTLPISEAVPIIEQAASALDYAHAHGIVHRDLKPGNILFHADGRLLLTDFGIAKVVDASAATDQTAPQTLTTTGTIIGTPEYLSPEQATASVVDGRSDIYSLGIVLFQMLSGQVPFSGATPVAIAVKHAMEEPPSLTQLNTSLSQAVEEVVRKALAKRPADRFATAGNFARALGAAAAEQHGEQATEFFGGETMKDEDRVPVVIRSAHKAGEVPDAQVPSSPAHIAQTPRVQAQVYPRPEPRSLTPTRRKSQQRLWAMFLCGALAVLLFAAAVFRFGLLGQQHASPPTVGQQASSTAIAQQTAASAASRVPSTTATLPAPSVHAGSLLYGSVLPACDPQQSSLWSPTAGVQVNCASSALTLTNTAGSDGQGVYLKSLPGGAPVPNNYVLEVQVHVNQAASAAFGIFFRTQSAANQKGAFAFLVSTSGNWVGNIYDNGSGTPSDIYGRQGPALAASGFTTIDVVVDGDVFALYFNGVKQGAITSGNYPSGNLGLVAEQGSVAQFKNLALYALQ